MGCCCMHMTPVWPFGKKAAEPRQAKPPKSRKVVEYERKADDDDPSMETMTNRSHLKDKGFKDAMALLGDSPKKK